MKKKSLILSFALAIVGLLSTFAFAGCGVSISSLKTTFNSLDKLYAKYSDVVAAGQLQEVGISTNYKVNYGDVVNAYVEDNRDWYVELETKYNVMLAVSEQYIDTNKDYILGYQGKMSKSAKKSLEKLDKSIKTYEKKFKSFVEKRKTAIAYFNQFNRAEDMYSDSSEYQLLMLKRSYGEMIEANISIANNLARSIELTEIFDLLKTTETTDTDVEIVKNYIQTKILPLYDEFLINEMASKLTWSRYEGKNTRIEALFEEVENQFENYVENFVNGGVHYKTFEPNQMSELFDKIDNFIIEQDNFIKAIDEFNFARIYTYAKYDGNLEKYCEDYPLSEVTLEKMEQFVTKTLPNFISEASSYIFN